MDHLYYEPTGLALDIFCKRYTVHPHESFAEASDRVSYHVSQAEEGDAIAKYRKDFSELLKKNLFMPGGRIWYGSGRPKGQLLNCFVIPTEDSREGWGRTTSDMIIISGTGGGIGTNYSPIRPRGTSIAGTGGTATGAVSLMSGINAFGEVIKAGGGRRTALMMALAHNHGDIVEFLDAKLDHKQLNNANVSVILDENPEVFFNQVKKDLDVDLKFRGKITGKIKARELWHKILSNALKGGEPGILNGYLANKMSNVGYYSSLICTNPCGEIWLSAYESCCLGSLVLPRFVDETKGDLDWEELKNAVTLGVRFLDDVLTVNTYPLPEIKSAVTNLRRIGLGVMGLHDMLLQLGYRYSSSEGLEFVDKVMGRVKNWAYEASIALAREKGAFPKFDADKFIKSGFIKTLKPSLRENIHAYGVRNCALLTIAPTGTTSMVSNVTSGIEPMFAAAYLRRYQDGEKRAEETVVHPLFKRFMDEGRSVSHFQGAHEIHLKDHFEMQRTCQRHLDNACSKTINVPQGTSEAELSDLYMEFLPELKGVTVYPDGSRENQPLTPINIEDAIMGYQNTNSSATTEGKCKSGVCEL